MQTALTIHTLVPFRATWTAVRTERAIEGILIDCDMERVLVYRQCFSDLCIEEKVNEGMREREKDQRPRDKKCMYVDRVDGPRASPGMDPVSARFYYLTRS